MERPSCSSALRRGCRGQRGVRIPGFAEKMREIDHGQRIGAGNIESSSDRQARQRTASPQDRHRAFEAAQIEIPDDRSAAHARDATLFRRLSYAVTEAGCRPSVGAGRHAKPA